MSRTKSIKTSANPVVATHALCLLLQILVNMFVRSALLSLTAIAAAKQMPKDEFRAAQLYDSGIKHMNNMALKEVSSLPTIRQSRC